MHDSNKNESTKGITNYVLDQIWLLLNLFMIPSHKLPYHHRSVNLIPFVNLQENHS